MKSMQFCGASPLSECSTLLRGGQFASTVGPGMTRFGLGLCVLDQTGDIAAYTILLFIAVLPFEVASILADALFGHWNHWWTMTIAT